MKNQFITINIPIYDSNLYFFISDDEKFMSEKLKPIIPKKEFKRIRPLLKYRSNGFTISNKTSGIQIIIVKESPLKDSFWLSVLVHETLHATIAILKSRNLYLDDSSEEAYTYLNEYIFEEIYDLIKI
ncbi:MAG: hypothetical protein LBE36_13525 [Flavobacteriaceae bacterium]|jgi:hypothetical protein|nr:hypothetical protein [Flavobacteriaceae bacterium]